MVTVTLIAGRLDSGRIRYRYDVPADVLSVRLVKDTHTPATAELTAAGDAVLRAKGTNRLIGRTLAYGWRRAGVAGLPDSMAALGQWAAAVAADL